MKTTLALLFSLLVLTLLTGSALACGCCNGCDGIKAAASYSATGTRWTSCAADATSAGLHTAASGLKTGVHFAADLPGRAIDHIKANGAGVRDVVLDAAYKTQITFAKVSAEVTSLSLHLLRSVFSTFWGLLLGLLR